MHFGFTTYIYVFIYVYDIYVAESKKTSVSTRLRREKRLMCRLYASIFFRREEGTFPQRPKREEKYEGMSTTSYSVFVWICRCSSRCKGQAGSYEEMKNAPDSGGALVIRFNDAVRRGVEKRVEK